MFRIHSLVRAAACLAPCLLALDRLPAQVRVERGVPNLPKAITSFGAARSGEWIYVYGGHVGLAHAHSRDNLSGSFYRYRPGSSAWETLPSGQPLQSPSLVAHEGFLYRIGGLDAKNAAGEKSDLHSVDSVQRYDPARRAWTDARSLPERRSSHDAFVIGDTIYVVGGWTLSGKGTKPKWLRTTLAFDVRDPNAEWVEIPQPFETRALSCAESNGKLIAIGGIGPKRPKNTVWVLDPATRHWSEGPEWNGFGFATSATTLGSELYACGLEGVVFRLDGRRWTRVTTLAFPRFFHRLAPYDASSLAAIAGADKGAHASIVERVDLRPGGPSVTSYETPYPGRAKQGQAFCAARDALYVFGGTASTEPHGFATEQVVDESFRFHPASMSFLELADLPAPRLAQVAAARTEGRADGTVHAFGGLMPLDAAVRATNEVFAFDLRKRTWSPQSFALPEGRIQFGVACHGGKTWIFGGVDFAPDREQRWRFPLDVLCSGFGGEILPSGARLPRPRRAFAGAVHDGRYYLVGGYAPGHEFAEGADVYDFGRRAWSEAAPPSRPRSMADLLPLGGKLYLVGGWSPGESDMPEPNRSVEVFDPDTGEWSVLIEKLPFAAQHARAVVWHHRILFYSVHDAERAVCRVWVLNPARNGRPSSRPARPRRVRVAGDRWPAFRGGSGGVTAAKQLPVRWSARENIAWSVVPPGFGQSSPVVWGDRVFVTSVEGPSKECALITCYRASDGRLLWSRSYVASLAIESTNMVSRGAPTPAVDANGVYAFFESGDLVALTHDGETKWRRALAKDYGEFEGNHGVGSSLVLVPDGLVLLLDHAGPSYLIKIDRRTGKNVWKTDREPRVSWATPVAATYGGGHEIVVSSNGSVEGFDAASGRRRWIVEGIEGNTVPSPCVSGGRVIVPTSKGSDNLAVERPLRDAAGAKVVWRAEGSRPTGFASPIVVDGQVYLLNKAGSLACVSLADGSLLWRERIAEGCWASPISDGERIWFFGKTGKTTVVRPGRDGAETTENEVATEDTVYGVAAAHGAFFVREGRRLYRIGELAKPQPNPGR